MSKLTRETRHREFLKRAYVVFQFLIDDYGFELNSPPLPLNERDISCFYTKEGVVSIRLFCESVWQSINLQHWENGRVRVRGLHQLLPLRCPEIDLLKAAKLDNQSLTEELEFRAEVLKNLFQDFLEGDPSVLYEPIS